MLGRRYLYLSMRGLLYLLVIWMWQKLGRRWTALGLIPILQPFRPRRRSLESLQRLPRMHQPPPPRPQRQRPSRKSSHQDPRLRPGLEESVRGVPGRPSRHQESVRWEELTPARRGSRGGSLV